MVSLQSCQSFFPRHFSLDLYQRMVKRAYTASDGMSHLPRASNAETSFAYLWSIASSSLVGLQIAVHTGILSGLKGALM